MDPCGECPGCVQVAAGTHPDLILVAKPEDKSFLPLELLIGDKEHRMREGLCHDIGLKPFMGGRKVAIIDDADHLNAEGANCAAEDARGAAAAIGADPDRHQPGASTADDPLALPDDPLPPVARGRRGRAAVASRPRARRGRKPGGWPPTATAARGGPWSWPTRSYGRSARVSSGVWPNRGSTACDWPRRSRRLSTRRARTPRRAASGSARWSDSPPSSTATCC